MTDRPVTEIPVTHYPWNGDVAPAYQVLGDGPVDPLYVQRYASHVDLNWGSPALTTFLTSLADNTRLQQGRSFPYLGRDTSVGLPHPR